MSSRDSIADIVIVGAGLVGLPLAHVLASQEWQVVLLDAAPAVLSSNSNQTVDQLALQQQCTALSLSTQQWLQHCGLWAAVDNDAAPIRHVFVSHKGHFGVTRLHAQEIPADALGYVVNNAHLVQSWKQQLDVHQLELHSASTVVAVEHQEDYVTVHLDGRPSVSARLILAADGVSSVVRESSGIANRQFDYDQAAALGTVKLAGEHKDVAFERFTQSGPLALLPRRGPYMSFVDCMDTAELTDIKSMDDTDYLARLQSRFGYRLGRFEAVGPRFVTPLLRIEAQSQVAPRTVLLGNAARLLHPVGGQGYNLAMRDVAGLVKLLSDQSTPDPGDPVLLEKFVEARSKDQKQVVLFTDAMARGFRGEASLPGHIRAAALLGLDTIPMLRNGFARRAMGFANQ